MCEVKLQVKKSKTIFQFKIYLNEKKLVYVNNLKKQKFKLRLNSK